VGQDDGVLLPLQLADLGLDLPDLLRGEVGPVLRVRDGVVGGDDGQARGLTTRAPRAGRMSAVPAGKRRQNSRRTRPTSVADLVKPWYAATASSMAASSSVLE
jgi:hypothetical protein